MWLSFCSVAHLPFSASLEQWKDYVYFLAVSVQSPTLLSVWF